MYRFQALPVEVLALRYSGQMLAELPDWLREFKGANEYGGSLVARSTMGELLIPIGGRTTTVRQGDYVVLDGTEISILRPAAFEEHYTAMAGAPEEEG